MTWLLFMNTLCNTPLQFELNTGSYDIKSMILKGLRIPMVLLLLVYSTAHFIYLFNVT